ncbi:hypothetical protein B0A48_09954 [Cryoendolithus antarcticus]|uniref:CENP-S associating centromere protein X domain-containing protein n=1 Tax=Cryoendolithus antarcticus TaxID=1507870 RepID=A0A1V8T3G0_9PEZI|nr:hypothetical protein B0A48_09954 [Cryoendolithus antarcticus]
MPPRKEPKETVTYNMASKSKAPAFKPQRPSQVARVASLTESEGTSNGVKRTMSNGSSKSNLVPAGSGMFGGGRKTMVAGKSKKRAVVSDDESDHDQPVLKSAAAPKKTNTSAAVVVESDESGASSDLADDPLKVKPRKALPAAQRKVTAAPRREPSPMDVDSSPATLHGIDPESDAELRTADLALSQSGPIPSIPRPLLLRLMHEHFASKSTQIDKHAIAVLEKYFEVFLRETIARAALAKKEDVELGKASQSEEKWLEKGDLEKVVPGIVMDF